MFLRRQLSRALVKKVDISTYLFSSSVAVNVDEPTVNEDLENSKHEESVIRSNTNNKNTKQKSKIDTKVNSNTNNNVGRQRTETEKKGESHSKIIHKYINMKDKYKSQKIMILRDNMIKNIKGWEISKKSA